MTNWKVKSGWSFNGEIILIINNNIITSSVLMKISIISADL